MFLLRSPPSFSSNRQFKLEVMRLCLIADTLIMGYKYVFVYFKKL
jgi:hypothetical protein